VTLTTTEHVRLAPAGNVDVRPGDVLVSFDGQPVDDWDEFRALAEAHPQQEVVIGLERAGTRFDVTVTLATRTVDGRAQGFFGLSPKAVVEDVGMLGAVDVAVGNIGRATVASVRGLGALVVNFGDLIGAVFSNNPDTIDEVRPISPIGLVRIAGPIEISLQLLAFVNVFVGVLNVVPLYPLDGGHFSVALYEKIRGRQADVRRLLPIAAAVFVFIILLGLLGFYFDIVDPLQFPE
jgi:membrane-associated protease RseP (regulator of RpoE activity)